TIDGVSPPRFARLLAKIGHSFAVKKLGRNAFAPLLLDMILGKGPIYVAHFIGSVENAVGSTSGETHEISIEDHPADNRGEFVTVRLRLFATYPTSTHHIVVGRRP
ncbi:MAG TPA: hypothetical protein VNH44_04190, partial [Micropepsaceae bacterium]|nr:hypothetical protein [Micropepsaceae bacterium]